MSLDFVLLFGGKLCILLGAKELQHSNSGYEPRFCVVSSRQVRHSLKNLRHSVVFENRVDSRGGWLHLIAISNILPCTTHNYPLVSILILSGIYNRDLSSSFEQGVQTSKY